MAINTINLGSILPGLGAALGGGFGGGFEKGLEGYQKSQAEAQKFERDLAKAKELQSLKEAAQRNIEAQKFIGKAALQPGGIGGFLQDKFGVSSPQQRLQDAYQNYQSMLAPLYGGQQPFGQSQASQFQYQQPQQSIMSQLANLTPELEQQVIDQTPPESQSDVIAAINLAKKQQEAAQDEQLRMQREQEQPTSWPKSIAQTGTQLATTIGTELAGLKTGALPADLLLRGLQYLPLESLEPSGMKQLRDPDFRQEQARKAEEIMAQSDPNSVAYKDAQLRKEFYEGPEPEFLQALRDILPTGRNLRKLGKMITKGTPVYDYLWPNTKAQKVINDVGKIAPYVMQGDFKNAGDITGKVLKSIGVASALKGFGLGTEYATGSEAAGKFAQNLGALAYNLIPGTFNQAASRNYKKVDEMLDKADAKNIAVTGKDFKPFNAIDAKARKYFLPNSADMGTVNPYLAKYKDISEASLSRESPTAVYNFAKELRKAAADDKISPAASNFLYEMRDDVMNVVENTLNKVQSGGGNILKDANSLYRAIDHGNKVSDAINGLTSSVTKSVSNNPLMFLLWMKGGLKALAGARLLGTGADYISKVITNPAMRREINNIFKASLNNNTGLLQKSLADADKLSQKIAPKTDKILRAALASIAQQQ